MEKGFAASSATLVDTTTVTVTRREVTTPKLLADDFPDDPWMSGLGVCLVRCRSV